MAGDSYTEEREYSVVAKVGVICSELYRLGRITVRDAAAVAGCKQRRARRILEGLAEPLGLYKDGVFFVLLAP